MVHRRRWTFYVLIIWSTIMLALIAACVPETYHPVLLRRKAIKLRKETGELRWKAPIEFMQRSITQTIIRSCYRPFLLLTLEPMCLNLCLFSAILLGVLYLFFGAFELVFQVNHHFGLWQIGLTFSGLMVGQLVAIGTDPFWNSNYLKLVRIIQLQISLLSDSRSINPRALRQNTLGLLRSVSNEWLGAPLLLSI